MTILVTRPEPGASRTVAALEAKGLSALSCPLFSIVSSEISRPSGKFAALLVTSSHGAAGLTPDEADLPANMQVFAVGDRTAEAMTANGFSNVTSASGDQKALTRLVLAKLSPRYRVLLATGEDHKDGLPAAFAAAGHEIALWIRYRAEPVTELPEAARAAINAGWIDKALHYSRRASETFVALIDKAELGTAVRPMQHFALSVDVAEPLIAAGFSQVAVPNQPDEQHILALVTGSDMVADEASAPPIAERPAEITAKAGVAGRQTSRMRKTSASATVADVAVEQTTNVVQPLSTEVLAEAVSGTVVPDNARAPVVSPPVSDLQPTIDPAIEPSHVKPSVVAPPASPPLITKTGFGLPALIATSLAAGMAGAAAMSFLTPWLGKMPGLGQFGISSQQPTAVADISSRLAKLEAPSPVAGTPELQAAIQVAVQNTMQSGSGSASPQVREQISGLERRIAELAARPLAGTSSQESAAQTATITELRSRMAEAERAAQALAPRLAEVEKVARTVGAPSASATGAAKLIVADRLSRALAEGRPFATEMSALTAIGAAAEPMQVLAPMAANGAPALAAIHTEFRTLRPLFAAEPASPNAPWSERLLKLTDGLVRVRSTGAVQGRTPAAVASRIDQALQRGDSAAAVTAFAELPEPARRAGEAWIATVRQRASADQAIKSITDDAIKALSAPK